MKIQDIYDGIKKYFTIDELVGKRAFKKYGERAWRFLDPTALHALLIVREGLNLAITVNGGKHYQRGLRTNLQQILRMKSLRKILYISAHVQGKAFDFDVDGMTSIQVRRWINLNNKLFPMKIRLERRLKGKPISWTHMDTHWEDKNPKIYQFDIKTYNYE